MNRRIVLNARPKGAPKNEDFRVETVPVPSPASGELLVRTVYLSLDPYMRSRMSEAESYAKPSAIGDVMPAGAVSEVVEAQAPGFAPGDLVVSNSGWQEYAAVPATEAWKIETNRESAAAYLGVLGMPGMTAYTGLLNIGRPKPGETVVVGAAAGAVGSAVGQIARIKGCRAVGIAGGAAKCAHVVGDLGFDACIDHRSPTFADDLRAACPGGIDIYFENVGGKLFEAVLPLMNLFGRIPLCGLIAYYNMGTLPRGVDRTPIVLSAILVKRLTVRGFMVFDFASQRPDFTRDMSAWLRDGRVRHREHVVEGFDNIIPAFQGLFRGENIGKLVVKVGP